MKEQRKNKIVYFTLTSAAEAPVGLVIRKAGLPPLFFSFLLFFSSSAPSCSARSPLMKLQEFRGISPEHKAPWEEQTLALQWRRGLSPWWLPPCAYTQECCHSQLQKSRGKPVSDVYLTPDCLPHPLFCMLIKMFVLPKKCRVLSNFRGADKPMTQSRLRVHCGVPRLPGRVTTGFMMSARSGWTASCSSCWIGLNYDLGEIWDILMF